MLFTSEKSMTCVFQEMDGASDDEEEDQRIPNGDHSQNLREDDEDLMDPVDVRITSNLTRIYI